LFLETWLAWLLHKVSFSSTKALTGVRKDLVDTKKAKLEIDKLEDEAEKRESLVTPATFEDVKNYDPKYGKITATIKMEETTSLIRSKALASFIIELLKELLLFLFILRELLRILK